jgi:hypothetical protein
MKPATIAFASIAGTLGVVAAVGFAQPDGLEPPDGMVTDTQPSLASISDQIASISSASDGPSSVVQVTGLQAGGEFQLSSGRVLIERVIMQRGFVRLDDAASVSLDLEAARILNTSGATRRNVVFTYELNVVAESAIVFESIDTNTPADVIVVFKELP